jgi:hypothetical protein
MDNDSMDDEFMGDYDENDGEDNDIILTQEQPINQLKEMVSSVPA